LFRLVGFEPTHRPCSTTELQTTPILRHALARCTLRIDVKCATSREFIRFHPASLYPQPVTTLLFFLTMSKNRELLSSLSTFSMYDITGIMSIKKLPAWELFLTLFNWRDRIFSLGYFYFWNIDMQDGPINFGGSRRNWTFHLCRVRTAFYQWTIDPLIGADRRIWTYMYPISFLLFRRQALYPAKLRRHKFWWVLWNSNPEPSD
jgi:hypothetical protein